MFLSISYVIKKWECGLKRKLFIWSKNIIANARWNRLQIRNFLWKYNFDRLCPQEFFFHFFLPTFVELEVKRQQTPPLLYPSFLGFVPPPSFYHFLSLYLTLGSPSFLTTSVMLYVFILHFGAFSMMSGWVFFGYDLREDDGIFMFYKLLSEEWEFECL